jgi:putative ABC transport system permease protein
MESFLQDLRFGIRRLVKRPGFTLSVLSILALGVGANTAMFSVVDAVILRSLPYAAPDQLVALWEENPADSLYHQQLSPVNFVDYRSLRQVFSDAAVWWQPQLNLKDASGEPVRVESIEASGNLFTVLGVQPLLGPGFTHPDKLQSTESEAVISHSLWKSRYGGDPAIIGKPIKLDGRPYSVVGVMPPGFQFPAKTEVWQRLSWDPAFHSRRAHFMEAIARLAPGVTLPRAQAELASLSTRLAVEHPDSNQGRTVRAIPLSLEVQGIFRPALLVLRARPRWRSGPPSAADGGA